MENFFTRRSLFPFFASAPLALAAAPLIAEANPAQPAVQEVALPNENSALPGDCSRFWNQMIIEDAVRSLGVLRADESLCRAELIYFERVLQRMLGRPDFAVPQTHSPFYFEARVVRQLAIEIAQYYRFYPPVVVTSPDGRCTVTFGNNLPHGMAWDGSWRNPL